MRGAVRERAEGFRGLVASSDHEPDGFADRTLGCSCGSSPVIRVTGKRRSVAERLTRSRPASLAS